MLRIGQPTAQMPPEEEATAPPEATPQEAMPEPQDSPENQGMGGGIVDPESARYFGPEARCQSCIHYMDPGSCELVSGPIDPQGMCMLFAGDQQPMEMPEAPLDMPTEEAPVAPDEEIEE